MRAVLWCLSLEIQGTVVEAMTVGVTSGEIQPVRNPLGQGRLQAVVVRMGSIRLFVNYLEIGEIAEAVGVAGDSGVAIVWTEAS